MAGGGPEQEPDDYDPEMDGDLPHGVGLGVPDDLADPRWSHYRNGTTIEFEVDGPDGDVPEDEIELEMQLGNDVWEGEQGPLAKDLVELREIQRFGLETGIFAHLVGLDEVRRLRREAKERGDHDAAIDLMWEEAAVDDTHLRRAIFGYETNPDDSTDSSNQVERTDEEPEPPVSYAPSEQSTGGA